MDLTGRLSFWRIVFGRSEPKIPKSIQICVVSSGWTMTHHRHHDVTAGARAALPLLVATHTNTSTRPWRVDVHIPYNTLKIYFRHSVKSPPDPLAPTNAQVRRSNRCFLLSLLMLCLLGHQHHRQWPLCRLPRQFVSRYCGKHRLKLPAWQQRSKRPCTEWLVHQQMVRQIAANHRLQQRNGRLVRNHLHWSVWLFCLFTYKRIWLIPSLQASTSSTLSLTATPCCDLLLTYSLRLSYDSPSSFAAASSRVLQARVT